MELATLKIRDPLLFEVAIGFAAAAIGVVVLKSLFLNWLGAGLVDNVNHGVWGVQVDVGVGALTVMLLWTRRTRFGR